MALSNTPGNLAPAIKAFWESCHEEERLVALSGSKCDVLLESLKLPTVFIDDCRILEVGVGLGYVTEGLHKKRARVSALDISLVGLERVSGYCEALYSTDSINSLPMDYFDFIVCANVVQHVPTEFLKEELHACIRALKQTTGILALQFISSDVAEDTGLNPSLSVIENGFCCRTPEYLERLVTAVGGCCELVVNDSHNKNNIIGNHVFHIRRSC